MLQALTAGEGDNAAGAAAAAETAPAAAGSGSGAACRHVVTKQRAELAAGMCSECYTGYVQASGGVVSGAADPPAFTRNLRQCAHRVIASVACLLLIPHLYCQTCHFRHLVDEHARLLLCAATNLVI